MIAAAVGLAALALLTAIAAQIVRPDPLPVLVVGVWHEDDTWMLSEPVTLYPIGDDWPRWAVPLHPWEPTDHIGRGNVHMAIERSWVWAVQQMNRIYADLAPMPHRAPGAADLGPLPADVPPRQEMPTSTLVHIGQRLAARQPQQPDMPAPQILTVHHDRTAGASAYAALAALAPPVRQHVVLRPRTYQEDLNGLVVG